MFPSKGTSVWVNFRDKPYLGKVLQTSPELDMVCVRICNYLNHVSRNEEDMMILSQSCPETNTPMLSSSQSSVVITCGLDDIFPLDSSISQGFQKMHINQEENASTSHSDLNEDVRPLHNDFNLEQCKIIPSESSIILPQFTDNEDDDDDEEEEDEEDFSSSFGINSILGNKTRKKRKSPSQYKVWKCRYCQIYMNDENVMKNHITTEHKLESHIECDNWIVVGGINGFDYDEIKNEDDNHNHLSGNINRKRQFTESLPTFRVNDMLDSPCEDSLDTSLRSDLENSLNGMQNSDINFSMLKDLIQKTRSLANDNDYLPQSSPFYPNSAHSNQFASTCNEYFDLHSHNHLLHYFLSNNAFQPPTSLTESFPSSCWSERYRSHSMSANYSMESSANANNVNSQKPMFSSPKRTRIEGHVKKCRKMYGIDQRHMWCNQCKWKKACSRFCKEVNTTL